MRELSEDEIREIIENIQAKIEEHQPEGHPDFVERAEEESKAQKEVLDDVLIAIRMRKKRDEKPTSPSDKPHVERRGTVKTTLDLSVKSDGK